MAINRGGRARGAPSVGPIGGQSTAGLSGASLVDLALTVSANATQALTELQKLDNKISGSTKVLRNYAEGQLAVGRSTAEVSKSVRALVPILSSLDAANRKLVEAERQRANILRASTEAHANLARQLNVNRQSLSLTVADIAKLIQQGEAQNKSLAQQAKAFDANNLRLKAYSTSLGNLVIRHKALGGGLAAASVEFAKNSTFVESNSAFLNKNTAEISRNIMQRANAASILQRQSQIQAEITKQQVIAGTEARRQVTLQRQQSERVIRRQIRIRETEQRVATENRVALSRESAVIRENAQQRLKQIEARSRQISQQRSLIRGNENLNKSVAGTTRQLGARNAVVQRSNRQLFEFARVTRTSEQRLTSFSGAARTANVRLESIANTARRAGAGLRGFGLQARNLSRTLASGALLSGSFALTPGQDTGVGGSLLGVLTQSAAFGSLFIPGAGGIIAGGLAAGGLLATAINNAITEADTAAREAGDKLLDTLGDLGEQIAEINVGIAEEQEKFVEKQRKIADEEFEGRRDHYRRLQQLYERHTDRIGELNKKLEELLEEQSRIEQSARTLTTGGLADPITGSGEGLTPADRLLTGRDVTTAETGGLLGAALDILPEGVGNQFRRRLLEIEENHGELVAKLKSQITDDLLPDYFRDIGDIEKRYERLRERATKSHERQIARIDQQISDLKDNYIEQIDEINRRFDQQQERLDERVFNFRRDTIQQLGGTLSREQLGDLVGELPVGEGGILDLSLFGEDGLPDDQAIDDLIAIIGVDGKIVQDYQKAEQQRIDTFKQANERILDEAQKTRDRINFDERQQNERFTLEEEFLRKEFEETGKERLSTARKTLDDILMRERQFTEQFELQQRQRAESFIDRADDINDRHQRLIADIEFREEQARIKAQQRIAEAERDVERTSVVPEGLEGFVATQAATLALQRARRAQQRLADLELRERQAAEARARTSEQRIQRSETQGIEATDDLDRQKRHFAESSALRKRHFQENIQVRLNAARAEVRELQKIERGQTKFEDTEAFRRFDLRRTQAGERITLRRDTLKQETMDEIAELEERDRQRAQLNRINLIERVTVALEEFRLLDQELQISQDTLDKNRQIAIVKASGDYLQSLKRFEAARLILVGDYNDTINQLIVDEAIALLRREGELIASILKVKDQVEQADKDRIASREKVVVAAVEAALRTSSAIDTEIEKLNEAIAKEDERYDRARTNRDLAYAEFKLDLDKRSSELDKELRDFIKNNNAKIKGLSDLAYAGAVANAELQGLGTDEAARRGEAARQRLLNNITADTIAQDTESEEALAARSFALDRVTEISRASRLDVDRLRSEGGEFTRTSQATVNNVAQLIERIRQTDDVEVQNVIFDELITLLGPGFRGGIGTLASSRRFGPEAFESETQRFLSNIQTTRTQTPEFQRALEIQRDPLSAFPDEAIRSIYDLPEYSEGDITTLRDLLTILSTDPRAAIRFAQHLGFSGSGQQIIGPGVRPTTPSITTPAGSQIQLDEPRPTDNIAPVKDPYKQTTGFNLESPYHPGLDLANINRNQDLIAPESGTIVSNNTIDEGGYGALMVMRGDSGIYHLFAHLDKINKEIGDRVGKSQTIGRLANFGRQVPFVFGPGGMSDILARDVVQKSSGLHAHWEVSRKLLSANTWRGGEQFNPHNWLRNSYQDGGLVDETGPAFLHAGEFVLNNELVRDLLGAIGNQNRINIERAEFQDIYGGPANFEQFVETENFMAQNELI